MVRTPQMPILREMSEASPTSVLVAADRSTTRSSLWSLLETEPGLQPVGVAGDLPSAIRQMRLLHPDVLLVSRRLLGDGGLRRLPMLALEAEGTAIVVIGMGDHPGLDALVRSAGGAGYIRLDEAAERLSGVAGMAAPPSAA
jgi:DNA-binding NarL/FixJ family response regulator